MRSTLTQDQVEDLLEYIGVSKVGQWKDTKINFCCPIHGESNPSCGINIDFTPRDGTGHYQVFNCFSCGEKGSIPWFLHRAMPEDFRSMKAAEKFILERYGVSFMYSYDADSDSYIPTYDELMTPKVEKRVIVPRETLAAFKSGKETFHYFFERGFTKEDMKEYMIGRDLQEETVTIPAFWGDGQLAGVIGRYIDAGRPKNARFKVYPPFPKGGIIYPLDKMEVIFDTLIGVEAMFDAILLRKWGYPNAIATMGSISDTQADMIAAKCKRFIALFNNDDAGRKITESAKKLLKGRTSVLVPSYYPEKGKDPGEWGELGTHQVIESARELSFRLSYI